MTPSPEETALVQAGELAERLAADVATLRVEIEATRNVLAHTDWASLPRDMTLREIATSRITDLINARAEIAALERHIKNLEGRLNATRDRS